MFTRSGGWVLVVSALVLGPAGALASVPVHGVLTATEPCEAFQSSRTRTNPGDVRLNAGEIYPIFELNVRGDALWLRVRIEGATPSERWVGVGCGVATIVGSSAQPEQPPQPEHPAEPTGGGDPCRTAGFGDSYVLALSWQPAFCETHSDKPECAVRDPEAYQAKALALHGLWPNRDGCGRNYGFCGPHRRQERPFSDYPPVSLAPETREALGVVMPSAAHGSCLQRHEWHKHGACQTTWDADGYYGAAMRLLSEVVASPLGALLAENVGGSVETGAFFARVDEAFGPGARDRVRIKCRGGDLVDVYLYLPADLPADQPVGSLLLRGPESGGASGCGARFRIDRIDD